MHESSRKYLSPFFLALTVFLFNVFLNDYDTHSPANTVFPQEVICIEFILEPENPGKLQINDDSPSSNLFEKSCSFISKHSLNNEIYLSRLRGRPATNNIINIHLDFPANHFITTLQKKNHWHQSSDDEPSPHIFP